MKARHVGFRVYRVQGAYLVMLLRRALAVGRGGGRGFNPESRLGRHSEDF